MEILGFVESLVFNLPATLGHAKQGLGIDFLDGKIRQPVGLHNRAVRLVLSVENHAHGLPAQAGPKIEILCIPDFDAIRTIRKHAGGNRVEVWDAQDFDLWTSLRWETVRVIFYRQNKPDGTVVQAYWLTNFSIQEVDSQALFGMAKSRWEIENQGFNEAKNLHGLEHLCHHHPNSMLIVWLLTALAMTVDRLYRQRYLHRGTHRILAPIDLVRILRAHLAIRVRTDSS